MGGARRAVATSCAIAAFAVAVFAVAGAATAGDWTFAPSIGSEVSVTDNARGSVRGSEKGDAFLTVTPGISVRGDGARLNLGFDYSFTQSRYADQSELDRLQHSLRHFATIEAVKELLFIDTAASISQQSISATGNQTAATQPTTNDNSTSVKTFSISPRLVNRFGNYADSQLRYGYSQFMAGALSDTETNQITETLTSGTEFGRLRWAGTLDWQDRKVTKTSAAQTALTGNAADSNRQLAEFAPEYAITRWFIATSSLGYEKISDPTLGPNQPNGPIGSVGARFLPGPRLTFGMKLNHRFDENYLTGDLSYLIGPTSRIDASYTRDIQNTQGLYGNALTFLAADAETSTLIDSRTLQPFQLDSSGLSLSNTSFQQKRFSLRFASDLERDRISAEVFHEIRESQLSAANTTTMGVSATWSRELQPLLQLNLNVRVSDTTFDQLGAREDQTVTGGLSFDYSLSETLRANLGWRGLYRWSSTPNSDIEQNIVAVGLRKTF
jgi:uncharacterized protein (PEP-CTERM system associated)